jgi:hypothetical protein
VTDYFRNRSAVREVRHTLRHTLKSEALSTWICAGLRERRDAPWRFFPCGSVNLNFPQALPSAWPSQLIGLRGLVVVKLRSTS